MIRFKILVSSEGDHEAVKIGWSWPAFFFTAIWALVKKMWLLGGSILVVAFALVGVGVIAGGQFEQQIDGFMGFAGLILAIIFGANGNKWRVKKLLRRGYLIQYVAAGQSPAAAIASYERSRWGKNHPNNEQTATRSD